MVVKKYMYLLYLSLKKIQIYKADFALNFFAIFIWIGAGIFNIAIFFCNTESFGNWNLLETMLLYGMWTITFAMYNILGSGLLEVENYIVTGNLDTILIKPINPLLQILLSRINIMGVSFWIIGLLTIIYSLVKLQLEMSLGEIIFLVLSIVSGGLIIFSIYLIIASCSFWILKTSSAIKIGYDIHKFVQYPIDVYGKGIKFILCTILPFAFSNYFPIAALLHKVSYFWGGLSIGVSILVFVVAYWLWTLGLKKYEGSGA